MRKEIYSSVVVGLMSLPLAMNAGGFKLGLQGNKQLGMGHTGVGLAQDAATIYFNPAGMSQVKSQIQGGLHLLAPSTSYLDGQTNELTNATGQVFTPFSLYATTKINKKTNIGLGVYTPFGSGMMYPTEWTGRYILNRINLQTIYIQPTISYKLSSKLALGIGYVYAMGNVYLQKDIPVTSSSSGDAYAELSGKAKGNGYNIGLYAGNAQTKVGFGITYHSRVKMNVTNGDALFKNIPAALTASFPEKNKFSSSLPMPAELATGISYKLSTKTTIAADINYTFWKSYDTLAFDYKTNTPALADTKSPRLYKNAWGVKFGIQSQIWNTFMIRGGFFYDQTPVQKGYVAPELPDNNKIGLTFGGTYKWREYLLLDFSLLYENVAKRTDKNLETGLQGTYKTRVLAPGVGINYIFGKHTKRVQSYHPRFTGSK